MTKHDQDTWIQKFHKSLIKQDLADNTIQSYLHDLKLFKAWLYDFYQEDVELTLATTNDVRAFREYLSKIKRHKAASLNRRLQAVKRFYKWLITNSKSITESPADNVRFIRREKSTGPCSLTNKEIHALLRVAGQSLQGLSKRNYAVIQILLQTGMRIGEITSLQIRDLVLHDRSGYAKIIDGKGRKYREVPLNATARRTIKEYLETRDALTPEDYVFASKRGTPITIRGAQLILQTLAKKAGVDRVSISAHILRHTFAINYLNTNPGSLVELATILGHDSLDTTAIYTRVSKENLSESLEQMPLNLYTER
jgi:integrase/recombinase XerC